LILSTYNKLEKSAKNDLDNLKSPSEDWDKIFLPSADFNKSFKSKYPVLLYMKFSGFQSIDMKAFLEGK
jgi:hypothetical protein